MTPFGNLFHNPHHLRAFLLIGIGLCVATPAFAQTNAVGDVPPAVAKSTLVGHLDGSTVLHISVNMPSPNDSAFRAFANRVSDPNSPSYRNFITPEQVGRLFGQTTEAVNRVTTYLKSYGFTIRLVAKNHLSVLADCTASQAEAAFQTTLNRYHSLEAKPAGRVDYFANAEPVQVPARIAKAFLYVSGMDNYWMPHPKALVPSQTRTLYNLAPIYDSGLRGQGRTVAISNFVGFRLSNLPIFYSTYGLPTPQGGVGSNVTVVPINGGSGSGAENAEGDLDMQLALAMAPLCNLIVYDGTFDATGLLGVLTQEANDNKADVISESYGWRGPTSFYESAHLQHLAMTAQGITYMVASGDAGTADLINDPYPDPDPEVLNVGGTYATYDAKGNRITEDGWNGSGGGWWMDQTSFSSRPSWQKGTGVPSGNFRYVPDLSLVAAGGNSGNSVFDAYNFVDAGAVQQVAGTSCSSPTFAGGLAVTEQRLIALGVLSANSAGKTRMGRIQDVVYQQNGNKFVWTDIVTGDTGRLPDGTESVGAPGWDTVTGWGAINFDHFATSLIAALTPVIDSAGTPTVYLGQGASPSGNALSLANVDGLYYTLHSVPQHGIGAIAAVQIPFAATAKPSSIILLRLKLVARGPNLATNFVYFYNWVTKAYDAVAVTPLTSTASTINVSLNNVANYVKPDASQQILVVDRAVYPSRFGGLPFTVSIDQAQILETDAASG